MRELDVENPFKDLEPDIPDPFIGLENVSETSYTAPDSFDSVDLEYHNPRIDLNDLSVAFEANKALEAVISGSPINIAKEFYDQNFLIKPIVDKIAGVSSVGPTALYDLIKTSSKALLKPILKASEVGSKVLGTGVVLGRDVLMGTKQARELDNKVAELRKQGKYEEAYNLLPTLEDTTEQIEPDIRFLVETFDLDEKIPDFENYNTYMQTVATQPIKKLFKKAIGDNLYNNLSMLYSGTKNKDISVLHKKIDNEEDLVKASKFLINMSGNFANPGDMLSMWAISKGFSFALMPQSRKLFKEIASYLPDDFQKGLEVGLYKVSKELRDIITDRQVYIDNVNRLGVKEVNDLNKLTLAERKRLLQLDKKSLSVSKREENIRTQKDATRAFVDNLSKLLSESGLPSDIQAEVIEKNLGKYMPRMFSVFADKGKTYKPGEILNKIWDLDEITLEAFNDLQPNLKTRIIEKVEKLGRFPQYDNSGFKNVKIKTSNLKPRMETKIESRLLDKASIMQKELRQEYASYDVSKLPGIDKLRKVQLDQGGIDIDAIYNLPDNINAYIPDTDQFNDAVKILKTYKKYDKFKNDINNIKANKDFLDKLKELTKPIVKQRNRINAKIGELDFIKNKEIPEVAEHLTKQYRLALGEIRDPSILVAQHVNNVANQVANNEFFQRIAANPEWVLPSKELIRSGYIRIPDSKAYGALANRLVRQDVANKIENTMEISNPGRLLNLFRSWKFGKTVLNPATHFRNIISNVINLDASGVDILDQVKIYPQAAYELIYKGNIYREALTHGALSGKFSINELKKIQKILITKKPKNAAELASYISGDVFDKAGHVYQAEEDLARMVKYIHSRNSGMIPKNAAKEAIDALHNYQDVPRFIKQIRDNPIIGIPFITYPYKALPKMAKAISQDPTFLFKYEALFRSMDIASASERGLKRDQLNREKEMAKLGSPAFTRYINLPIYDDQNNPYYLDLTYVLPWGDLVDFNDYLGTYVPSSFTPTGFTRPILDLFFNKNFKGREIYHQGDSPKEIAKSMMDHLLGFYLPSMTPVKGFGYQRIRKSVKRVPNLETGESQDILAAVADTMFGLKARPININKREEWAYLEIQNKIEKQNELIGRASLAFSDNRLTEQEFDEIYNQKMVNITRLIDEMQELYGK